MTQDHQMVARVARQNTTGLLRELFGGDRYARDWEYLDATFGEKAERALSATVRATLEAAHQAELVEAIKMVRAAIGTLPADALGMGEIPPKGDADFGHEYPIRDELLSHFDSVLAKAGVE